MIRMSKLADYAFVVLVQMAIKEDRSWAASDLAARTGLPLPTVAKVMKLLAKSAVVSAQRGASGGYRLARSPGAITVAEIIEAVDGPIALTDCVSSARVGEMPAGCCGAVGTPCPMHGGWNKVNRAITQALQSVSLYEMAGI